MKRLISKPNAFNKGQVLTRAQLKKVVGGTGNPLAECKAHCKCPTGYSPKPTALNGWDISVVCTGVPCGAQDNNKVVCGTTEKTCDGTKADYCEKTVILT